MATATQEFTVTFPADPDHSFLLFAVRLEECLGDRGILGLQR